MDNSLDLAVIIEPRMHVDLEFVLMSAHKCLHSSVKIQIFHGTKNFDFVSEITKKMNRSFILTNLNLENINSLVEYNKLLTSKQFWNSVSGENLIIFQTDSAFNSNSPHTIDEFIEYDYVGAPWDTHWWKRKTGGNGGFSFRRKSKILEHIEKQKYEGGPEDIYFSKSKTLKLAPQDISKKFSVETLYYNKPFGFHKPWRWLPNKKLREIESPELNYFLDKKK